jgi:hypothetical protein
MQCNKVKRLPSLLGPRPRRKKLHESGSHLSCIGRLAATPSLGFFTIRANRIVKVEPRPGLLSTVMSPPIIWQNRRLIARPRPVPPYLFRRHADAGIGHGKRDPIAVVLLSLVSGDGDNALLGVVGVACEVEQ